MNRVCRRKDLGDGKKPRRRVRNNSLYWFTEHVIRPGNAAYPFGSESYREISFLSKIRIDSNEKHPGGGRKESTIDTCL